MCEDVIGPSEYSKGQGLPVKLWGLLVEGVLHVEISPEGEVMNSTLYSELIENKFSNWTGSACYLVQDFERALRAEEWASKFSRCSPSAARI